MAARGIYCSAAGDYAYYDHGSALFGPSVPTVDFSLSGWHRVRGHNTVETYIPSFQGICVRSSNSGGQFGARFTSADGNTVTSPFLMRVQGNGNAGTPEHVDTSNQAIDEDWFEFITYSHTTGFWTFYYGKDGDSSLTTVSTVLTTSIDDIRYIQFGGTRDFGTPAVCLSDLTNGKAWTRAFTATEALAEMKSEAPVISTGLYGWWKLPSSSDLTDSSGNGRTLTAAGSLANGISDPVDIQSAARRRLLCLVT